MVVIGVCIGGSVGVGIGVSGWVCVCVFEVWVGE